MIIQRLFYVGLCCQLFGESRGFLVQNPRSSPAAVSSCKQHGTSSPLQHADTDTATFNNLFSEFENDLNRLSQLRPPLPSSDPSLHATLISAGSSYTRLWTASTWVQHSRPPHSRYARHIWRWRHSSTAKKVLPAVLISTAWATLVSVSPHYFKWSEQILASAGSVAAATSVLLAPLALLLTLRANCSLGRLLEARLLWGRMVLHTRTLASLMQVYLLPHAPKTTLAAARLLAILSWQLKAYVRGESVELQREALNTTLDKETVDWILDETQQPYQKSIVTIPSRIRQLCHAAMNHMEQEKQPNIPQYQVENEICKLEEVVGGCERLHSSPIPPTYSRHLSRVMALFNLTFPISLVSAGVNPFGVIVVSMIASYVFIGIDEVGMEIENAFQLLPLQQLAAASQKAVLDQFLFMRNGPPLVTEK
ncbi:unnamed protein product [Cylindrotheca closterium]|uniref:Uncharacterized protein n=1 Tax=Cylindrotheca closterium TaxID=2856 RepID=A0AAD2G3T0_9STRA|nr:unnamed protein product [Cylindrotheca closterium]